MNTYVGLRRSGISVILLGIVTLGIYYFFWYYTIMEDINRANGEQRISSTGLLIGSIFCPPLIWVVLYKVDKELALLSQESGTHYKENFIMWLLLTFLCGIGSFVAVFQICGAYNDIWDKRSHIGTPLQ